MTDASANLLAINKEVREARLDWLSVKAKRIEAGYEWAPAEAEARQKMLELAKKETHQ
jgi:hypothetical protein